ncbi:PREDICTED: nuclear pore complex protein NUP88 isoform X2 [Tarenaya hassleriana]|uniref:nuclear pore complex protein NUP88 isoform X2 n=1 Tax=Tarenaya hassleriana TaxID=28532 RepID=UPI00053C3BAE|nr:PREDICTED: nuclear pore complex protein NUP88 isoform X2 [Tarenaya hassleriana]
MELRGSTSGILDDVFFTVYLFAWGNLNQPPSSPKSPPRNGSAILLAGSDGICVMFLFGRTSVVKDTVICRTVSVGSDTYLSSGNVIHLLQASWHPNSDTHLGVLSSDSVFRLFDLSLDPERPEQEYYLQPVEPGRSRTASSICAVDFSFGGDHLWDRFSVFVLFTDGSIYILCPVVPFGSIYKWESIMELYSDANLFGPKSSNSIAVNNSNLAISWLEATFPDLSEQETKGENISVMKAQPYALFDASLALQGPLYKVSNGEDNESFTVREAECKGRAVSLLYNLVSKDSILVTAWSGGQLQIDALADEIQPVWISDSPPRLCMNSSNKIVGVAMISESNTDELPVARSNQPLDHTVWLGHPPPLLRLVIVDLALPMSPEGGSLVTLFPDPLVPERIYSLHDGGIDSITLHFLPFTSQTMGKDDTIRTPSVHPVLSTCQEESYSSSPLLGCVPLSDSFGYSWIFAVLSTGECIVLEMKTWDLLLPLHADGDKSLPSSEGQKEQPGIRCIISKELLAGPKMVLAPQALPNQRSTPADSIEGRSVLHQYFKLFHENYVEYAHKVYFELNHHAPNLKRIIDDQNHRLAEARQKISKVKKKQSMLEKQVENAIQTHDSLEQRLQRLRSLPGAHKRPLMRAEREFKSELDEFSGVELDALRSSIETLRARMRKHSQQSPKSKTVGTHKRQQYSRKDYIQDTEISQIQSSMAKLSVMNSENSEKVKLVESALKSRETSSM